MKDLKIIVLCGGISPERDVSLVSGDYLAKALSKFYSVEKIILEENKIPANLDPKTCIVHPVLHGEYGENGDLQKDLEDAGITYVGSNSLSSKLCMLKPATKAFIRNVGVKTAKEFIFDKSDKISAKALRESLGDRIIIKPADKGSSVGLSFCDSLEKLEIALQNLPEGECLAESYFEGRELSVGVLGGEVTGIVEIAPAEGLYDYETKYNATDTKYTCPALLDKEIESQIKEAALKIFNICQCRDFARIDFIVKGKDFICLEVNTLPGMTPSSLLPKTATCVGLDFDNLCKKMLSYAIERHKNK
ncbi:MAG: D-alanine--D-alanine ligase [Opitutales bacterium]